MPIAWPLSGLRQRADQTSAAPSRAASMLILVHKSREAGTHPASPTSLDFCDERYEQPLVEPQVSHFRQVPFRTMVKLPHSEQLSPS